MYPSGLDPVLAHSQMMNLMKQFNVTIETPIRCIVSQSSDEFSAAIQHKYDLLAHIQMMHFMWQYSAIIGTLKLTLSTVDEFNDAIRSNWDSSFAMI